MQILPRGQSRFLSHSSRLGHISLARSTHFLSPPTVSAHWHWGSPPHLLFSGHRLLLMAGSPWHAGSLAATLTSSGTMFCAPAARENNASSPVLPTIAAPAILSALLREMASAASPWLSSSKSCPSEVCPRAISRIVRPCASIGSSSFPSVAPSVTRGSLTQARH